MADGCVRITVLVLTFMVTSSLKRVRADRFGGLGYARRARVSTFDGVDVEALRHQLGLAEDGHERGFGGVETNGDADQTVERRPPGGVDQAPAATDENLGHGMHVRRG